MMFLRVNSSGRGGGQCEGANNRGAGDKLRDLVTQQSLVKYLMPRENEVSCSLTSSNTVLEDENENLKKMLASAEKTAESNRIKMKAMKQDIFLLHTAYAEKCQENKRLQHGRQAAYAVELENNERLVATIDALVEDRHEMRTRHPFKSA